MSDEEKAIEQAEGNLLLAPESLEARERQANAFAAEILMPEEACKVLFARYSERFGPTARFIEHHMASDLLVSREAAHWRLIDLGLIPAES